MVTFVGNQTNFSDALKELVELEYAVVEAYETAIERLNKGDFKERLQEFLEDHQRHIREISGVLEKKSEDVPQGPNLGKEFITKGKVLLANMVGDNTILIAMRSNETDTNTAYERLNSREDIWGEARDILKQALEDERKHKAWLDQVLE